MNLFFDTNIFYSDPLWNGNKLSAILKGTNSINYKLFFSEVVLLELKAHYLKQIRSYISLLDKNKTNIEKYSNHDIHTSVKKLSEYEDIFDNFYDNLFDKRIIHLIRLDNAILPKVFKQHLRKETIFFENKNEFKDAVIWESFSNYAKENQLKNCFLISNDNVFTGSEPESHIGLLDDNPNFKIIKNIDNLFSAVSDIIEKETTFQKWVSNYDFKPAYVFNLLEFHFKKILNQKIESEIENYEPTFFSDRYNLFDMSGGYTSVTDIVWEYCENVNVDIFGVKAIVSGDLKLIVTIELFKYNSVRDSGDDKFQFQREIVSEVTAGFNFLYDRSDQPTDLEITDIYIDY